MKSYRKKQWTLLTEPSFSNNSNGNRSNNNNSRRGEVARAEQITVKYQTLNGDEITQVFQGFPARIVQHEVDHLDVVLFVERI